MRVVEWPRCVTKWQEKHQARVSTFIGRVLYTTTGKGVRSKIFLNEKFQIVYVSLTRKQSSFSRSKHGIILFIMYYNIGIFYICEDFHTLEISSVCVCVCVDGNVYKQFFSCSATLKGFIFFYLSRTAALFVLFRHEIFPYLLAYNEFTWGGTSCPLLPLKRSFKVGKIHRLAI